MFLLARVAELVGNNDQLLFRKSQTACRSLPLPVCSILLNIDLVSTASGFPPPNMNQEHRISDEGNIHL
jgi:hypothetical protein